MSKAENDNLESRLSEIVLEYKRIEGLPGKFNNVICVRREKVTGKSKIRDFDCCCSSASQSSSSPSPSSSSSSPPPAPDVICYFGGDIQNLRSVMIEPKYADEYSLEAIAIKLAKRFRASHILVVQPVRQFRGVFSCFDNFVAPADQFGTPRCDFEAKNTDHTSQFDSYDSFESTTIGDVTKSDHCFDALSHLHRLIAGALYTRTRTKSGDRRREGGEEEEQRSTTQTITNVALIGFSKGGCVLNAVVAAYAKVHRDAEIHRTDAFHRAPNLRLTALYYLDIGHNGPAGIYITNEDIIRALCRAVPRDSVPLYVHIGVTAFQLVYKKKRWIAEEEERFRELLHRYQFGDDNDNDDDNAVDNDDNAVDNDDNDDCGNDFRRDETHKQTNMVDCGGRKHVATTAAAKRTKFVITRTYLDGEDIRGNAPDFDERYLKLHFGIIDRFVDGKI